MSVDLDTVEEVTALLSKITKATERQPGVVFAYATHSPVRTRPHAPRPTEKLEELFEKS